MSAKLSFEESLEKYVLHVEKCIGCAACVVTCPPACLEYRGKKPTLVKNCTACGICSKVCPRYDLSWSSLEEFVFGRESNPREEVGIYRRLAVARTNDEDILQVCQDGGVVTSLLSFALENGIIEGAAVSGVSEDKPFYPVPRLATTPNEVYECAGTRYSYSPNLLAFRDGVKLKKKSLAFVGVPCQIHAIRKIQAIPLRKYTNPLQFTIGLMCTESFTYEGLMEKHIQGELGIDLHNIQKINIKAKVLVTTKSGEVKTIPLKNAKKFTHIGCNICPDFSSELADISVGGLGLSGWTFTILRTERGEELFENAENAGFLRTRPVEEEERALGLLFKLSRKKKKRLLRYSMSAERM